MEINYIQIQWDTIICVHNFVCLTTLQVELHCHDTIVFQESVVCYCIALVRTKCNCAAVISTISNEAKATWYEHSVQYTVWVKKSTPMKFSDIFPKQLGTKSKFYMPVICYYLRKYKFLFNYLQLWQSYAILSATVQFTPYAQNVHRWPKCTLEFSDIFPKQLWIFSPNFTHLLYVPIYTRVHIFIQLPPTVKLCHINCDHPACISDDGAHFERMMPVTLSTSKLQITE